MKELPLPVPQVLAADGGSGAKGPFVYLLSQIERESGQIVGGVFRSSDLGETWEKVGAQLEESVIRLDRSPGFRSFAVCQGEPEVVYLSCSAYWVEEHGFPQHHSGIMKTVDGGESWKWVLDISGGQVLTDNFTGGWLRRYLGWFSSPSHLGVCPTDPNIVYGTDSGRTFKSEDGGSNWEQLISDEFEDGSFTTRGLDVTTTYGVHFDPYDEEHIFITYTDIGLFHSYDAGETWHHSITGIPRQWRNTCYWLEFDPAVRGKVYSVWSNVHDLPRPKMHRSGNLVNGRQQGGVAVSGDGGRWWGLLGKGVMGDDGTHRKGLRTGAVCTH
ncbi:MAG: WD40/YVTN/BNR-like repeat-containing protein, partial [bacterium]